ncbi:hypothetical protein IWW42_005469 [Coemansia sp. RSA 1085]|nr:hypothetical protein IWW42_005469 [Coemansia sp. RSA 1085]
MRSPVNSTLNRHVGWVTSCALQTKYSKTAIRKLHCTRIKYDESNNSNNNSTAWPTAESVILQRISSTGIHPSLAHLKTDKPDSKQADSESSAAKPDKDKAEPEEPSADESRTVTGIISSLRKSRGASQSPFNLQSNDQRDTPDNETPEDHDIPYCLFNTHDLVTRLVEAGFTRQQATLLMILVKHKIYESMERLKSNMLTKSDLENDAYLFRAALQELRTETQMIRKNDQAILESQSAAIDRDIESLAQRLTDEIANLRSDIEIELNNHKHDSIHEMKSLDMELHSLASKYQVVLGEMKTDIETIKLESIRRGLLAAVVTTLALLAIIWGPELLDKLNLRRQSSEGRSTDSLDQSDTEDDDSTQLQPLGDSRLPESGVISDGYIDPARAAVYRAANSPKNRQRLLNLQHINGTHRRAWSLPVDSRSSNDLNTRYRDHSHLNIHYDPTISASESQFGTQRAPLENETDNYDDWFDSYFYPPQDIAERRTRSGSSASLMDSDPTFDSAYWRSARDSREQTHSESNNDAQQQSTTEQDNGQVAHIPINFTDTRNQHR